METNFNFKSQPTTSIEQSKRLLSLGLREDTADMAWTIDESGNIVIRLIDEVVEYIEPAWSLYRLWELTPKVIFTKSVLHLTMCGDSVFYCTENNNEDYEKPFSGKLSIYDNIINCIEWLIKEGYFPKEYLNGIAKD